MVGVTSTSGARTIVLPDADSVPVGSVYVVKDESGGAGTNNVTVGTGGGAKGVIDGLDWMVIAVNYGYVTAYSNGTDWFTTSKQLADFNLPNT
jgi:hypothetical protein